MKYQRATQSAQKEQSRTPPSSSPHQTSLNRIRAHPLLELQRTIGNQAVLNLLHSRNMQSDTPTQALREPRFGHDLSQLPIHPPAAEVIQTKLATNSPGDEYEQEADQVADRVIATPTYHAVSGAPPHIQRFGGQTTGQPEAEPASVDQVLANPGTPLEPALRQDMEQRFGHDFSQVRVHSGAAAEQSAQDVNANAYTVGHDMVFGASLFAPETYEGRRLIAHELTHVVQQSSADGNSVGQSNEKRGLSVISNSIFRLGVAIQRDTTKSATKPSTKEKKEERFPWIGHIHGTYSAALRSTPHKDPDDPHTGTIADLAKGTFVDVFERKGGWLHVRASVSGKEVEGYVSQELVEFNHLDIDPAPVAGPPQIAVSPPKELMDEDPRESPRYIDNLFQGVTLSGFNGASVFDWQENGKEHKIGIPFTDLEQDDALRFAPIFEVHNSKNEALKTVKEWASVPSSFYFYSFYRTPDNVIMPTTFSIHSTPEFHKLWPGLKQQLAEKAEDFRKGLQPLANAINPFPGTRVDEYGNLSLSGNPLDWLGLLLHLPKLRGLSKIKGADPIMPLPEPLSEPNIPEPKEPVTMAHEPTAPPQAKAPSTTVSEPPTPAATVPPKPEPPKSVWVQLRDGTVREYEPSTVEGDLAHGAEVSTAEGKGKVVGRGEPPHSSQVSHPEPPIPASSANTLSKAQLEFAEKVGLNAKSLTGKQILGNLDTLVTDYLAKFRQARVRSLFPGELLNKTIREALLDERSIVRKLLTHSDYDK